MREIAMNLYQQGLSAEEALPIIKNTLREKFPHAFGTPHVMCDLDAKIIPFFSQKSGPK